VTNNYPASWQASIQTPITVNIPPKSGNYAGKTGGYVEVIVTYNQARLFSSVFGTGSIPVTARAVARGAYVTPAASPAVMAIDSTPGDTALSAQNGQVIVQGPGNVIANSNASTQANGSALTTQGVIDVTGSWSGNFSPSPTKTPTTPDPYAFLPAPSKPGNGTLTYNAATKTYDLYPGYFSDLTSIQNNRTIILHQSSSNGNGGIFYLDGANASINFAGQTTIQIASGESGGMMFYVGGSPGNWASLTLAGQGLYQLPGLSTTTSTYQNYLGFLIDQAHGNTQGMSLGGNASGDSFNGFIYAPDSVLTLNGNGLETINHSGVLASQIILKGNNETLTVTYQGSSLPLSRVLALVE
jgi:hypothetical protein